MQESIFRLSLILISLNTLIACENLTPQEQTDKSNIVKVIDGGSISPTPTAVANPRFPALKTYGNIGGGYFSVVMGASYNFSPNQEFMGAAANKDALMIGINRTDSSGLKWIDIYNIARNTTAFNFICKIRNDGNFSDGLRFDNDKFYIKNNSSGTYNAYYRKFNATDCSEEVTLTPPAATSLWTLCDNWDVFKGDLQVCFQSSSNSRIDAIRSYNAISGLISIVTSNPSWNDFSISYTNSGAISRTSTGVWSLQHSSTYNNYNIYFVNSISQKGNWATLPGDDYPDFSSNAHNDFFSTTDDDKNLYIISTTTNTIRFYLLDVESF